MKKMIRITSLLLAGAFVFLLGACASPSTPETGATGLPTESRAESAVPPSGKAETASAPAGDLPTGTVPTDPAPSETAATPEDSPYEIVAVKDAKVGDVIVFGSYEQDGNAENGKEPLEWLVLAGEGDSLLVITLYAIEHMQFHTSLSKVTWETSAVRAWLNGDFISAAFSPPDSEKIKTSHVIAEKNPNYPKSPAGNDTEDKVFLLNVQEVALYFKDNAARKCAPTEAIVAGSNVFSHSNKAWYARHDYLCSWWLRSPGTFKETYVSYVDHGGSVSGAGQVYLSGTDLCVRPAMWITVE